MNQPPVSNDSMDNDHLRRARELLPWYAQGQLTGDDQVFMTHWLENTMAHHPTLAAQWQLELAAEQAWLHSTRSHLQAVAQQQAAVQSSPANEAQGLAALMQRIAQSQLDSKSDATKNIATKAINTWTTGLNTSQNTVIDVSQALLPPSSSAMRAMPPTPSVIDRIATWLDDTLGVRSPAMAFGIAAVVLAQAGVIGALLLNNPAQQAPLSGTATPAATTPVNIPAATVLLTVAFAPQATELAMRQVLAAAGAQLVAGPSALGLYTVAVPAASADTAIAQLRAAQGVVDLVQR
jgi:hypothetical protein